MLVKLEKDIVLKPFSYADVDEMVKMLDNPNINKYIFFAPAPEKEYRDIFNPMVEKFQKALEDNTLPEDIVFAIRTLDDEFIGELGIYTNIEVEGVYEVAYQIKEEFWGRGIATIVCNYATDFIFNVLKGHRAEAECYSVNKGSRRVLERCGFTLEEEVTDYFKTSDGVFNKLIYGKMKE